MSIRRSELAPKDIVRIRGYRATCIGRTLKDVCRRLSLTESVVIADMAAHAGLIDAAGLAAAAMHYRRLAGIARFREVVGHVEPEAESRMETRLRMLLVLNGLPRPQAQVPILDDAGVVIGRPDLYYPDRRLGIEYDGSTHRDSLTADNRRQNRLLDAGLTLLRFSAGDISQTPQAVVRLVRSMLAA